LTKENLLDLVGLTNQDYTQSERLRLSMDFFLSSMHPHSKYKTLEEILEWLQWFRKNNNNIVERIAIKDLEKWYVEETSGNIRHESGKFFSIEGVRIQTKDREIKSWSQPIMNQPEVGILGIIVKKVGEIYYFLMQAKTEPGNIDGYQISPTIQATASNYTKVHGGKLPKFVDIILNRHEGNHKIIYEGLQSEEGARFWKKNNLNIILGVGENELAEIPPEFCWMTLYQLKKLLLIDNVVNACARSVISCIP